MLGTLAVMAAAVLWAAGASIASRLFDRGLTPLELTAARAWIAAAGLSLIAANSKPSTNPTRLTIPFGLSIAAANFFYYLAVSRIPVAIAIVIQYTAPGLVVLWTALVDKRRPARATLVALVLALAGVALIAGRPNEATGDTLGLAAAATSALAFAAYILLGDRVGRSMAPPRALLHAFMVSGVLWTVVLAARAEPLAVTNAELVPGVLAIGVTATLAPFLLFLWGMNRIGPAAAGIASTLEPLAGALIAFAWLGQRLDGWQIAGGLLIVAGIGAIHAAQRSRQPAAVPP